jgi:hypothetical protein
MAQTAYEEAGMCKAVNNWRYIVMAHTDKTYKTLCTKINTEGRLYKDKSRSISYSNYESHETYCNILSAKQLLTSL